MKLKQSYYEQGEKASKLLAWHIKQMETERAINTIQTDEGLVTSDPKKLIRLFLASMKMYTVRIIRPQLFIDKRNFLIY